MDQNTKAFLMRNANNFPLTIPARDLLLHEVVTEIVTLRTDLGHTGPEHHRLRVYLDGWLDLYRRHAPRRMADRIASALR